MTINRLGTPVGATAASSYTSENARDDIAAALVAGANVTITPNDPANTITIAAVGGLFPLGCAENPVTDPLAARPTGIPIVHWRTATLPAAAAVGDVVDLPGSTIPSPPIYLETFDASIGTWQAQTNASSLTRDTGAGGGAPSANTASLRWTATAAGTTAVNTGELTAGVTASTSYIAICQFKLGAGSNRVANFTVDFLDSSSGYLGGNYDFSTTVTAGGAFQYLSFPFTTVASTAKILLTVSVSAAALGQQAWIDNVRVAP